jgi:ATP-dependent DNA helicase
MKLQNTIMQLRKVCSHPFLFEWPVDPITQRPVMDEQLIDHSGKMMILDRLLTELFKRKHKVLLFSQFTTMLDIIEVKPPSSSIFELTVCIRQDWAIEIKGWKLYRIDGTTPPLERRDRMNEFQTGGDSPDAPILFLLSTRAGGLGINLTAADTVVFYDQDWVRLICCRLVLRFVR